MEKKRFLVFGGKDDKFGIATLAKKEWKPEEEYGPSGGDVAWWRVDFYDGTKPITNRGESVLFLTEIKGLFKNPTEALMAHLPEVISSVLKCVSSMDRSLHPRHL
ncbi:MAG: hypothetical protein UY16_C0073G0002 [Candidatus Gottesmanbacteria bacterium GW2011_GWA2_47_9]|uniref:Uncharacterized protein n=1 Tax=Candidatus Gottesmanbacteria bacterium GW2011_GWA2_47_9 TaxID=1618445 RepID=A0A0G1WTZ9_9BACT|nr:MAG: hypothetical protein UU61_C0037G0002 [Parcubacteria group bacterium GW2011_GWB1_41_4]KKU85625.1 MAG: hypothetical protein UY16_C0073G0002 [Candidatus Gottesmanbacteria bacterium GW2011_GWA2_47_9]